MSPVETLCADGADDDGDGAIDCADSDCANDPACALEDCANGIDDDQNGDVDCADAACALDPGCQPGLVLNEVDYDQVGMTDGAEFIEIFNPGLLPASVVGLSILLVNGSAMPQPAVYAEYDLSPAGSIAAGGYLVLGPPGAAYTNIPFAGATNQIQNGNPADAVVLFDKNASAVVDALSYEGTTVLVYQGNTYTLVSGMPTAAQDSGFVPGSLVRIPNGSDTGNDAVDWVFHTPMVTPGAPNL